MFSDSEYADEIGRLVSQYEGKHSLLSIIMNEKEEKAEGYIESKIHQALYEVIAFFMTMSIKVKSGNKGERGKIGLSHPILGELTEREISREEQTELDKAEEFINRFFTTAYSDN